MKRTLLLAGLIAVLIPTSARSQTRQLTFPLGFAVDFGQIHMLSSGTQLDKMNIVVRNTGTVPVTITSATLTGDSDFVLSTAPLTVSGPIPFPVVLQPGQVTALVYVHFFPTQTGVRTASVVVTSDATGSPHTVSYRGEAVNTPLGPWPWTFVGPPLGTRLVNSIVVDPDDDNVWYVSSMSGLYITRNGGASWEQSLAPSGINGSIMGGENLVIDPTDTRRVYAAIAGKLYGSTDKGRSWAVLHTLTFAGFGAITVGDNGTVYATTSGVSGEVDDVTAAERAEILADCDIFASPSEQEAFGITTLEAWSQGKPVIVGNGPAQACVVDHGVSGLLVPYHDEYRLFQTLAELANDEGLRRRLGRAGQRRLHERYLHSDIVARYHALFVAAAQRSGL